MTEVRFGKDRYHDQEKMYAWCWDNLGVGGWGVRRTGPQRWGIECNFGNTCFYFRDQADAVLFELKWR